MVNRSHRLLEVRMSRSALSRSGSARSGSSRSAVSRRTVVAGGVAVGLLLTAAGTSVAAASPPAAVAGPGRGWVASTMAHMTLEEKVGQLFIQNVYGKDATTPDARNI